MDHLTLTPKQNDDTLIEKWWTQVRSQTMRLLPIESAMSLPIPIEQDGKPCLSTFYYGVKRKGGLGMTVIMPPIARIIATYPAARLLSFQHKQTGELFPGLPSSGELGGPIYSEISTPSERVDARKLLLKLCFEIVELFWVRGDTPEIQHQFSNMFSKIAESPLIPYYQALNPEFFSWLMRK